MATFRKIHTEFWTDAKVLEEMTPEDRYFYLYILTNSHTTQIGIYQISKKIMGFELGYSMESINSLVDRFVNHHKLVKYNPETREIAILKWGEYNLNRGGKPMEDCVKKELSEVKDTTLIPLVAENVPCESLKKLFDDYNQEFKAEYQEKNEPEFENFETDEECSDLEAFDDTSTIRTTSRGQEEDKEEEEEEDKDKDKDIENKYDCCKKLQPVVESWNNLNLQKLNNIKTSSTRYKLLNSRIKEHGIDGVIQAIDMINKSDFLRGQNKNGWIVTFDWFIKPNNFIKVFEGNYTNLNKAYDIKSGNSSSSSKSPSSFKLTDRNAQMDPLELKMQKRMAEKLAAREAAKAANEETDNKSSAEEFLKSIREREGNSI